MQIEKKQQPFEKASIVFQCFSDPFIDCELKLVNIPNMISLICLWSLIFKLQTLCGFDEKPRALRTHMVGTCQSQVSHAHTVS